MYLLFGDIEEHNKSKAIDALIKDSSPKPSFFFLVAMSVAMATCGLLINNASVIIGSMLIAPILSPMLSMGLGVTLSDNRVISRAGYTLLKSMLYSVILSAGVTWLLWQATGISSMGADYNMEILSRTEPSIVYLFIAILAGAATAFARVKPDLNDALPGTAIAVALVPPLATIGIGVATLNMTIVSGALAMFILNGIGIVAAAIVMFSLMDIHSKRSQAGKSIRRADEEMEKVHEKVEEAKEALEQE